MSNVDASAGAATKVLGTGSVHTGLGAIAATVPAGTTRLPEGIA